MAMTHLGERIPVSDWQDRPIGRPKVVDDHYLERLRELASHSPRDYGYPFKRWTAQWLKQHLAQEFDLAISDRHINRLLKQMGLSTRDPAPIAATENLTWRSSKHFEKNDTAITIQDLNPATLPDLVLLPKLH